MFCEKCGAKIEDGAKFCEVCGAPVENAAEAANQQGGTPTQEQAEQAAPVKKPKKPFVVAAVILAVLVSAVGIVWYIASRPVTVNLDNYVTIDYSGYDTMGTAYVTLDESAFLADYKDKIKIRDAYSNTISDFIVDNNYVSAAAVLLYSGYLQASLDTDTDLTNGDTVTVVWDCEDELVETYFNVNLKHSETEYTVSGLQEIETVDVFEGIEVEFSGTAPDVSAEVVSTNGWLDTWDYTLSPKVGMENGDTITVSISDDAAETLLETYGVVPESQTTQVTVSGVDYYATSLDDITEEALAEMQAQSEDEFNASEVATWAAWDEDISLTSMEYVGCYFLHIKDYDAWSDTNYIYLVYKITAKQQDTEHSYYWFTRFTDGIVQTDGTFSIDYRDYDTPSNSFYFNPETDDGNYYIYGCYYSGYEDLDSLLNENVISKTNLYTYESSIEE